MKVLSFLVFVLAMGQSRDVGAINQEDNLGEAGKSCDEKLLRGFLELAIHVYGFWC